MLLILVGLIVAFAGYQLFAYGWNLIMTGWAEWNGYK